MATQAHDPSLLLAEFAATLLAEREVIPRARLISARITELVPGLAVALYVVEDQENPQWTLKAVAGDLRVPQDVVPFDQGTLGELGQKLTPFIRDHDAVTREDYAHLDVRRTIYSLAYIPLLHRGVLLGGLELISFESALDETLLAPVFEIVECASLAIASAIDYETERNSSLQSISRLAQLYDIEKVLNSTLEMDELLPIIASKFLEFLSVQAVNVWMVDGAGNLLLVSLSGFDPAVSAGAVERPNEGVPADVAESGEGLFIDSPSDPRLVKRNSGIQEGAAFSLMAAPIMDRECLVGVVEVINKQEGVAFDEDDLSLLTSLCETASGALHNASLLQAERKVEILEALVKTSAEITSTLDLDRVLQAIVNGPSAVVAYERAAVALDQRGGIHLKAVSGSTQINADDPQYRGLRDILKWGAILSGPLLVTQRGEEIDSDREETRAKFREYFAETGMRACHVVPLADEEGRLGILLFESSDPDFLSEAHLEMIKVLASQATVALRNASLYKEVPFIGVLQPLLDRKKRFLALEKHRRATLIGAAVAATLFLVAFPLPLRVDGTAVVAPAHMAHLGADFEGIIRDVNVREGDVVKKGTVIARLQDWEYRSALAAAKAKYETAVAQMDHALANNDGTEAGMQRAQADYWGSELTRAQERLDRTSIRSPIDGVVATPQLENMVGRKLKVGDSFVDIVDNSRAMVDVAVTENDVSLLRSGENASLKLDGFPELTFHGQVAVVSPQGVVQNDEHVFFARVSVVNPNGALRSGMQGRGKVSTGWRPAGVVMFRKPGMWIWSKIWDWFGW
jgi:RND family efflux transporter MFP subunit